MNVITKVCMKMNRILKIENLQEGPGDFVTSADKRTEKSRRITKS